MVIQKIVCRKNLIQTLRSHGRSDNENIESLPGLRGPIPSFHFFTANKRSIDKIAGYYETEDFLGYIKEIAEDEL